MKIRIGFIILVASLTVAGTNAFGAVATLDLTGMGNGINAMALVIL